MDPRPGRKADQLINLLCPSALTGQIETVSSPDASG